MTPLSAQPESLVPAPLASGTVRGGHIVFLYFVIWVAMAVLSAQWTRQADPAWRSALHTLVFGSAVALLVAALSAIVPELRRSVPLLYRQSRIPLTIADVALTLGLGFSWANGAFPMLFVLPVLSWRPELASLMGYGDRPALVEPAFVLLWLAASVLIAPLAEELVFRGYLQNLWTRRWGLGIGIALSSIAFGATHMQFAVFAAVMGIGLSLVYARFRSLWPGTLLHALHNLVIAPFAIFHVFTDKSPAQLASVSGWIPEILMTGAFFPLAYLFWRRFRPAT